MEKALEQRLDQIERKLDQVHGDLKRVVKVMDGNGGNPPLLVRLDRLEQSHKVQSRFFWIGMGAVIPAVLIALL